MEQVHKNYLEMNKKSKRPKIEIKEFENEKQQSITKQVVSKRKLKIKCLWMKEEVEIR